MQAPPAETPVNGVRAVTLSSSSKDVEINGLDIGVFEADSGGDLRGVQVTPLFNGARSDVDGLQLGLGNRVEGRLSGVQLGTVAYAEEVSGVQVGVLGNRAGREMSGAQIGLVNRVTAADGAQIGIVNFAEAGRTVQFGLLNFHRNGLLPVLPLFNVGRGPDDDGGS